MLINRFKPLYVGIYLYFINVLFFSYSAIEIPIKGTISQVINYVVILLLLTGFVLRKKNSMGKLQFCFFFLGIILAYLCEYQVNSNLNMLVILLVGISIWDFSEFDFILSNIYKILIGGAIILFLLYIAGMIGRYYGFWVKNSFGVVLFTAISIKLFLKHFHFDSPKEKVVWIGVAAVIMVFVESRTAAILNVVMIVMALINSMIDREGTRKIYAKVIFVGSAIIVLVYFLTIKSYISAPGNYEWLNTIFSGRLEMIDYYLSEYDITLFGKYLVHHNGLSYNIQYRYLDSSYFYLWLSYGVVFSVIIALIYLVMIYHAIQQDRLNCVCCLCINLLYGISELNLFSGFTNFILFSVVLLLRKPSYGRIEGVWTRDDNSSGHQT